MKLKILTLALALTMILGAAAADELTVKEKANSNVRKISRKSSIRG